MLAHVDRVGEEDVLLLLLLERLARDLLQGRMIMSMSMSMSVSVSVSMSVSIRMAMSIAYQWRDTPYSRYMYKCCTIV